MKIHILKYFLITVAFIFAVACSHKTLNVYFDLPETGENESAKFVVSKKQTKPQASPTLVVSSNLSEMKSVPLWMQLEDLLPKDSQSEKKDNYLPYSFFTQRGDCINDRTNILGLPTAGVSTEQLNSGAYTCIQSISSMEP